MSESREQKIEDLKEQRMLAGISYSNAVKKIQAGGTVAASVIAELKTAIRELAEEIKRLEVAPEAAATASSPPPVSSVHSTEGAGTPLSEEEIEKIRKEALVERMILRPRSYTMTEHAKKQRKDAANSPEKSAAMRGNKNAWKTGQFAQGFIRQLFRPCLSSCPNYPCDLIDDGEATLGNDCPDKAEFVKGLSAIQKAMRNGDLTDLKEIAALRVAGNIELLGNIQAELMATRGIVLSEKLDKDGKVIGNEMKAHPLFLVLPKLTEVTKMTAADFMVTPLEIKRQKTEAKKAKALSNMMSGLGLGEAPGDDEAVETADESQE